MKNKPTAISDQLRQAILDSGKSRYLIWQETGIAQSILSRFVNEEAGISLDSIDKLGECLGLQIVEAKPKRRKGKK